MAGFFGGASNEQKWLGMDAMGLAKTFQGWMGDEYKNQQDVLNQLRTNISRIASGETGMGFGMTENNLLQSQILNANSAAARNATQATMNSMAGLGGGGTSSLARSSATTAALRAGINTAASINQANQSTAETLANIQQGRQNALQTAGGLSALAGQYNPLGYAGAAMGANKQAFGEESELSALDTQRSQAIGNLVMKGVGMAAGGLTGGLAAGGGLLDTLKGVAGGMLGDGGMFLQNPSGGGGGGGTPSGGSGDLATGNGYWG